MPQIDVLYTRFSKQLPGYLFNRYLSLLPFRLQDKNLRYRRWQDRHSHLFGKLLLLEGLKIYGYTDGVLNAVLYNQYSRPYLNGDIDFNISHSGEYVFCAIGKGVRLGIDVEEITQIDFDAFRQVMTKEQWQDIFESEDPRRTFFNYWTIKESVIKADSRGLSIPLLDIHVKESRVDYGNHTWHLYPLGVNKEYSVCLSTDWQNATIKTKCIEFSDLENWEM